MEIINGDGKAKIIAYYLPQFYPCEFNDKWYGKGFTEWTNVGKAKPLFPGHYQPRVPADLGYYDLRLPEVAEQQVQLAKEAGVFGFCYWHYWWGEGRMLLNMPAERMLKTGRPDFPFCFGWDNGSWFKKKWDKDKSKDELIMEMRYPGPQDEIDHFNYCLPFFKDERYIRYDGRPVFYIYGPLGLPDAQAFIKHWNRLLKESGVADSFYFIGQIEGSDYYPILISQGFDAVTTDVASRVGGDRSNFWYRNYIVWRAHFWKLGIRIPIVHNYNRIIKRAWVEKYDSKEDFIPFLIPNWDHTARSGGKQMIITGSTPRKFAIVTRKVLEGVKKKNNKLVFLKSWNEWAEGNYMEPDLRYGKGYIETLGRLVNEVF